MARTAAPPTADTLFTVTQVTLVRGMQALEGRGVNVFVAPATRSEPDTSRPHVRNRIYLIR